MSGVFDKGSAPKGGYSVTGGGTNAPWTWGVSPFDQTAIDMAGGSNMTSMRNRYDQLGMGGSTPEGMDLGQLPSQTGGIPGETEAMTGQLQTQNVGNPALNPALQPQLNSLIANPGGSSGGSSLASLAGLASGLGGLGGSAAAGASDATVASDLLAAGVAL